MVTLHNRAHYDANTSARSNDSGDGVIRGTDFIAVMLAIGLGTIVFAVLLVWSIFALQKYQSHVLWANVQGRVTGADEKEQKHRESCHTNWTKAKISDTVASSIFAIASGLLTGYGDTVNRPDPLVSRMLSIIGVTYGIFSVILAAVSGLG